MSCNICEQEPCSCTKQTYTLQRDTSHRIADGITKEEFGLQLYETIFIIGRLLTVRKHRASAVFKHQSLAELDNDHAQLTKELAAHMVKLTADEAAQIVQRYPWCAHI